jgi:AcrR family transcriptional regulator
MSEAATKAERAPRRDAQARREALLVAAAETFQRQGYDVPLEAIADAAGVGRGTLYRNFKDREALALAIFSREIDRFEATFDAEAPIDETLRAMVRDSAPVVALFRRIAGELDAQDSNLTAFRALGERLEAVLAPGVARAQAKEELAATVTPTDIVLAIQMAAGLIYPFLDAEEVATHIEAALRLLLWGMRPR